MLAGFLSQLLSINPRFGLAFQFGGLQACSACKGQCGVVAVANESFGRNLK